MQDYAPSYNPDSFTQREFWQLNIAAGLADLDNVVTTYGDWHLPEILALMNPCGDECRAFLGCGHLDCAS